MRIHVRVALAATFFAPTMSVARASSDHFVESQVSSARLASLVRTHLETEAEFCPESVTCPDSGGSCIVDRLEYPSDGRLSRGDAVEVVINGHTSLPAEEILLTQPVTVQVKTTECAYRPGCETTTPLAADLEVELTTGDGDSLCFVPRPLRGLPFGVQTPEPFCIGADLEALGVLTGNERSSITGKAVSLGADGARVGVRFELDRDERAYDAARLDAWSEFLAGRLGPVSGTPDWSAFAHQSLLQQSAQATVETAFAADPDLALLGVPTTTWTGLGSAGGTVDLSVGAEYDACVDISPVTMSAQVSIDRESGGITTDGTLGWDVDEWDAVRCGFLDGFVLGAIAGPIVAASIDLEDLGQSFGSCEVTGDDRFWCEEQTHPRSMGLGHGASLESTLDSVFGHPTGLELSGTLTQLGGGVPSIEVSLQTPTFGYRRGCEDGACGYLGGLYLSGNATVCSVEFGNDPLRIFAVDPPDTLAMPASFAITVHPASDEIKQDYIDAPYGMNVTVFSSSGAHTWPFQPSELLPVRPASPSEDEAVLCGVWNVKDWATGCLQPDWRPGSHRFEPQWSLDPRDRVVALLDERGIERDFVLVEEPRLDASWNASGQITGIRITALAYIARQPGVANTQEVEIAADLPRGVTASSLEEAIVSGFPGGVWETVEVEPAFVPVGTLRASFDLGFDPRELLDLIE